jgi:glucose-6-phosphate isomerase
MTVPGPRTPEWTVLRELAEARASFDVPAAFTADPGREERYTRRAADLTLDLSRQCIDEPVLAALCRLLDAAGLRGAVDAMWRGDPINNTEDRAAWHVLLRRIEVVQEADPGAQTMTAVIAERERMLAFAEEVRGGGKFDTVINIGIGGSDLGPAMATQALRGRLSRGGVGRASADHAVPSPTVHFVSNVDACALHDLLDAAAPQRTLFVICSKTFTTQETLANATRARDWIRDHLGESAIGEHFAAVSVNAAAMDAFGIAPQRRFSMWDWVGGRYSLWSNVGLTLAIAIGRDGFVELLAGGRAMDEHFRTAPWTDNLPALLAAAGVWNIHFRKLPTLAVLPYSDRLARFPAFLQQLEMESNGKSVTRDGEPLEWETAPVVWGEPGNNAQHSFFQMLHQGTRRAALDVILLRRSPVGDDEAQRLANANGLAQIETFAAGQRTNDPHRRHAGSVPQSVILLDELRPSTLGALVALYEHKVYVQSVIWGINAFDQFGVELGKQICARTLTALDATTPGGFGSIQRLLGWARGG